VTDQPDDAAVTVAFLAALAQSGVVLPPDRAEAAVADALALHRQILLVRAACPPGATLPLGFVARLPGDGA
jgi:hypothetical protein